MKVNLAGYNIDNEIIKNSQDVFNWMGQTLGGKADWSFTPETISAAYARISRSKKDVDELRKDAIKDVNAARESNENIVYDMGHASISEHSVFNFDIINVSRLAIEFVESFRLASYTEKSQRYVKLSDDFHIPDEIKETEFEQRYINMINEQNAAYKTIYEGIKKHLMKDIDNHISEKVSRKDAKKMIIGKAKEDARYITSLATYGQLGMTANARSISNMVRRHNANPLFELRELGQYIYNKASDTTPSLVKYPKATSMDRYCVQNYFRKPMFLNKSTMPKDIHITDSHCPEIMNEAVSKDFVLNMLDVHSAVPREWEFMNITFHACVSASCFAQLKRHRMGFSMVPYMYDINNGNTVPKNVEDSGMGELFREVIGKTNNLYADLYEFNPFVAQYILTQSHKRWVLCQMNGRELYAFARLREDGHAQWDIRNLAHEIVGEAKELLPDFMDLACGKDEFKKNVDKWNKKIV